MRAHGRHALTVGHSCSPAQRHRRVALGYSRTVQCVQTDHGESVAAFIQLSQTVAQTSELQILDEMSIVNLVISSVV